MMLYDALEEILPFHDCAKNTICNCFSGLQIHNNVPQGLQIPADGKSAPTLWAQNTGFLT